MSANRVSARVVGALLSSLGIAAVLLLGLLAFSNAQARGAPAPEPHDRSAAAPLLRPQDVISIPRGSAPTFDGFCGYDEYADASTYDFDEAPPETGSVYLKHDDDYLYVCIVGVQGSNADRFASVYLDTDNGAEEWAEGDDLSLRVGILDGSQSSWVGTGVMNGYVTTTLDGWAALTDMGGGDFDQAEYVIPVGLTGGECKAPFGLAVYHHWVNGGGDDYGWPINQWYDEPMTWQPVALEGGPCATADMSIVM